MLTLEHFFHLPQLDPLIEQLVADGPGLIVVAGVDPRSELAVPDGLLPSGRSTIFRILMREILESRPGYAIVVTEDESVVRIPRQIRHRVRFSEIYSPTAYANQIAAARRRWPSLLVIDRLCAESVPAALEAARDGFRVLSQIDTVFWGSGVVRHLCDLGASRELLRGLTWVISIQRLPLLCPDCKQPVPSASTQLAMVARRYPELGELIERTPEIGRDATFWEPVGCADCHQTGRSGDVACFDVWRADADAPDLAGQPSLLPLSEYTLRLAAQGSLSLEDVLWFEADQLRRTYSLLTASEEALARANEALRWSSAATDRVLRHRNEALISLQEIGQALISSADLHDLAARVCQRARDLCGADRAILYFASSGERAEVLAESGWGPFLQTRQLGAATVFAQGTVEPIPFNGPPPGVRLSTAERQLLRAGLFVPLVAQDEWVGLMIVHSTQKASFQPGEVALLRTFANQAALAIQRAGLIEQLRAKIVELEAAQAELVEKERMERELELAHQVQQSMLPREFPQVAGYAFAARSEPAREVGGDFYDVFTLDGNRFGLAIADVSDKGMPAAVYMALTRSLLLAEARRDPSPCAVLTTVNRLLLELCTPQMFVSVFYGVVDPSTGRLAYTRAGHDRPLLLRGGAIESLGGRGAVLGFLDREDLRLSEEECFLASGDRLVLYTDGMTDVVDPEERLFGLDRFTDLLRSRAGLRSADLCAATFAELAAYRDGAKQYDDMTMLVVEVK